MGQKEPPRLGSTTCYGQELARKSHQDSAVRPERATKTRQYDLLRPRVDQKEPPYDLLQPNVGKKEPPRLGSTICYGQELARKSHQDPAVRFVAAKSTVRFVTAKRWPERVTKTRQYDLLRPRVDQKEPPYDLLQPNVGKKEPPRLGRAICYGRVSKTRQYDLLRPNVGQKEPPRLGNTICYGQTWARKSHRDSAVRFVTAKRGPERATETRQYDLLRPSVGQKEPPRLGSTICYGQDLARKIGSTICGGQTWARKSHQDSAVRFVTAKSWPERATKTRQYDLLRPNLGQKEPPRLGNTICYGQTWARKSHRDSAVRFVTAKSLARKSHQDSAIRFVTAKSCPERATKTRQYDLLRPRIGQKEPPRLGSTICYGQELARKSRQDAAVRLVTAKRGPERVTETRQYDLLRPRVWPERATKTRQYDLLRPRVGQKEPPRLGSTICYGQELRATNTRQCDLLRPIVGQKKPPRLGSTICYDQTWVRKSHQDSAVRFVTAKSCPERATKTRQYDLLRPRVGQKEPPYDLLWPRVGKKEPPRLGSAICCGQTCARKSHQHSAVRFITAKRRPERATKTR